MMMMIKILMKRIMIMINMMMMMMMMMMMIIMTLLGSSLLKAGVKDMGDLATLDSQSIRPIHPNLLHPDDDVGWG